MFDTVVDEYVRGRPDMPLEAVQDAARELGLAPGDRVLEVGAGTGALTVALVAARFDVTALEPGPSLRARAAERAPATRFVGETFEDFETDERFAAVFSSNAFHWVDPAIGYTKAAALAEAIVLVWDLPFPADPRLHRQVQDDVMGPRGSTFPNEEAGVRELFRRELVEQQAALHASDAFGEPWSRTYEQRLAYTPERYVSLLLSMSAIVTQPEDVRADLTEALRAVVGDAPFTLTDLVYVVAAKAR